MQLHAAGHPDFQNTSALHVYELVHGLEQLEQAAAGLRHLLAAWQDRIQAVHAKYTHTYFLSTHQLVFASELLKAQLEDGTLLLYQSHSCWHKLMPLYILVQLPGTC